MIKSLKSADSITHIHEMNRSLAEIPLEIANILNKHFASMFPLSSMASPSLLFSNFDNNQILICKNHLVILPSY